MNNKVINSKIAKCKIIILSIFLFFWSAVCVAQQETTIAEKITATVTALQVEGNKSLSGSAILAKVKIRIGDKFSKDVLNQDIKRLYATGYFEDVRIKIEDFKEGKRVIFEVKEKPVLKAINIKGNTVIDNKTILDEITFEVESFLDVRVIKSDIANIERLYIEKGFPEVKVSYDIDVNKQTNSAVINIEVMEGAKLKIERINIEGNEAFSDKRIIKLMETKRDTFFTSGIFKESVLKEDISRIESFYRGNGYLDVIVAYNLNKIKRDRLIIDIIIQEGKQYVAGEIEIEGNQKFAEENIRERLQLKTSDVFTQNKLKRDIGNIQSFYFDKGHIFAGVRADTILNPKTGEIDIKYNISEGELAYVDKIKIEGNTKTKDVVIRREMRIFPGEKFDGSKLRRSKERLDRLGIFQSVSFDTDQGIAPNRKDLVVEVKEAKTGEFSFGAGYSSVDDFVGFVELRQRNFDYKNWPTFTGDGQKVSIKAEFGTVKQDYDLSFTEPWIFNRPISFGFDVFQRTRDRDKDVGYAYDEQRKGGDIRLGREFSEYYRGNLMFKYEQIEIEDVAEDASSALKDEEGDNVVSSLRLGLNRDTRDSIYNPTKGSNSYFTIETAGGFLGSDKEFMKYTVGSSSYYNFIKNQVLELRLRAGVVDEIGDSDNVPIYERFFAGGGNTIRGYDVREVGPKDSASGDPVGGESMLIGNLEYIIPIIKNFRGAFFFDIGNVWENIGDFGQGNYAYSVGTGIRINTPIGPVKLDYGFPLETDVDSNGRFHFSMGRIF